MNRPDVPTLILEFTPTMRTLIEDAIETLILLLDEIDGDADFEHEPDRENEDEAGEPAPEEGNRFIRRPRGNAPANW